MLPLSPSASVTCLPFLIVFWILNFWKGLHKSSVRSKIAFVPDVHLTFTFEHRESGHFILGSGPFSSLDTLVTTQFFLTSQHLCLHNFHHCSYLSSTTHRGSLTLKGHYHPSPLLQVSIPIILTVHLRRPLLFLLLSPEDTFLVSQFLSE